MTDTVQPLLDVNLHQIPDSFLRGSWRIVDRALNRVDPASPLAQATHVHLQEEQLQVDTPSAAVLTGNWRIERDALLSRPYLLFQFAQEQVRVLITRLRRSADGEYQTLVLYFQSGLELFLAQP